MDKGIGSWIVYHSQQRPEKIALKYKDKQFTYQQFNSRVNKLANSLMELGIRHGDRVNVLLFNSNELMETLFACAKIGAIFVPVNYRLSAEEVEYILKDSSCQCFIYDNRLSNVVEVAVKNVTTINHVIQVGDTRTQDYIVYESLIEENSDQEPQFELEEDDVHMMMYTSGTTGKPKGVMLTHGNTQWNAVNAIQYLSLSHRDVSLTVAPLFHIGGMNIFATPILYKGGTVILQDVFQPDEVLREIEKHSVTTLFLVPAMWMALMHSPALNKTDLSSLRINIAGGSPCPLIVIEFFQKLNVPFYEGFGLTETAPFVCLLDEEDVKRKNGSVGKTPMHTQVRIVNQHDEDVSDGEVGELLVKGPNVFKGYWNKPSETKKVLKDGWFYTGDLAMMDDEGFIYIVDRKKDMIISGGENIYPAEIEQVLYKHPNVKDVAVVGLVDGKWGEIPKAYVVLHDSERLITIDEVQKHCEGKLAKYKIPNHLEFLDILPRNATGKILKTKLRNIPVRK